MRLGFWANGSNVGPKPTSTVDGELHDLFNELEASTESKRW